MLFSNFDFYRLTCFHFVLNPCTLGKAGSNGVYFDSANSEKKMGKAKFLQISEWEKVLTPKGY